MSNTFLMIQNIFTKNYLTLILHIGSWCLVFLWPFLLVQDVSNLDRIIIRNWVPTFCILVIFYTNYWVLIDHFYFKKKKTLFFISNLLLIVVFFFLIKNITPYFISDKPFRDLSQVRQFNRGILPSLQFVFPMILSIGMCLGIKINKHWSKKEITLEKVKQSQLNSEIKYLRHQIQPHFLFNTLNNIYSLVDSAPKIAKSSIHSLSKMMRYLLHDSTVNNVPLAKEIEFLERYIDLMQLRVSSNLVLQKNFPVINQPIKIAPLLLISFIENAFKHGLDATQNSFININLTIEGDAIHFVVQNSSFSEKSKTTDSGIGLSNLKKRLELLYANKFELIEKEENNIYTVKLMLNFTE